MFSRLNMVSAWCPFIVSPIQTLMPPSPKGLAAAIDFAGVEGGDRIIEGHFHLPKNQLVRRSNGRLVICL